MKHRITYLLRDPQSFELSQLEVKDITLHVKGLVGAKEQRVTLALDELPAEVVQLLTQSHELHVRWVSPSPYESITPLVSRVPPGLHVFFSPHKNKEPTRLCPTLKKIFSDDLKCDSAKDSFTSVPILSERFAHSAASQFYQYVPTLKGLVTYVQEKVCRKNPSTHNECALGVTPLLSASYVDIDYDAISQALVVTAFWADAPHANGWTEDLRPSTSTGAVEVGVLNEEKATDPEELSMGGFLTIPGKDEKPKATLFAFPARHKPLPKETPTTFSVDLKQPTGLHPVLQLHFPLESLTPPQPDCYLHTYLTLPSHFFIDRYQLQDSLFLSSNNLKHLHALSGATDLEAPDYVVSQWGSSALFELAAPDASASASSASTSSSAITSQASKDSNETWTASIPLHLRYLPPNSNHSGIASAPLPWPATFWACPAEEGTKFTVNPFDRSNIGYDSLFGPRTAFYHIPPARPQASTQSGLVEEVSVPVLDLDRAGYVGWATAAAVALGTAWLGWKLVGVLVGGGGGHGKRDKGKGAIEKEQ